MWIVVVTVSLTKGVLLGRFIVEEEEVDVEAEEALSSNNTLTWDGSSSLSWERTIEV